MTVTKSFRTIRPLSDERYTILKQLVLGTFKVKTDERTREQRNTVTQFYRSRGTFRVNNGRLFYNDKEIVKRSDMRNRVKTQFNAIQGTGSRHLSQVLRRKYHGLTERNISKIFKQSDYYHMSYPKFTNVSKPIPVTAEKLNERWQLDLIDMRHDSVVHNGKVYKYILSVIDVFSRFLIIRPLQSKSSKSVAKKMEKIFSEHGFPGTVQTDLGGEFKGATHRLLRKNDINIVKSRPYHPQSQGKCERSHRYVRKKISFMKMKKKGFNWLKSLHTVQQAINRTPKEVLANYTPYEVLTGNDKIMQSVKAASQRCNERLLRNRKFHASVYKIGEKVLYRYPGKGSRVPKRQYIRIGTIIERNIEAGKYQVCDVRNDERHWAKVEDITSNTVEKENNRKENDAKERHRSKYYIVKTQEDKIQDFDHFGNGSVMIRTNPRGDGSCQFAALSEQLMLVGINRSEDTLRQEAVAHIEANMNDYASFVADEDYLRKMRNRSEFGDHLTLLALAREYNVQIVVLSSIGLDHTLIVSNEDKLYVDRYTLFLGHYPEHHYVSLNVSTQAFEEIFKYMDGEESISEQILEFSTPCAEGQESQDTRDAPFLPLDVMEHIVKYAVASQFESRHQLRLACSIFKDMVDRIPRPEIYIRPRLFSIVPQPLSMRRLVRASGKNSGHVIECRKIIGSKNWINAWMVLTKLENHWNEIRNIFYK